MRLKYLARYALLTTGFALVTFGLIRWHAAGFTFDGIAFFDNGLKPHPLHVLILGIAMIPPAIWELFLIEQRTRR